MIPTNKLSYVVVVCFVFCLFVAVCFVVVVLGGCVCVWGGIYKVIVESIIFTFKKNKKNIILDRIRHFVKDETSLIP